MKERLGAATKAVLAWVRRNPLVPAGIRGAAVGVVAMVVVALGSGTAVAWDRMHAVPPGAMARVGDTVITEQQVTERAKMMSAITGRPIPADKADLAKQAALDEVMADAAKRRNIVIADKTANDKLTELLERGYPKGRDDFLALMKNAGVSQDTVLQEVKRQLTNAQLFDQIIKDVVPPTDQEVAQYYEQHKPEMVQPERRHLRNIVVGSEDQAKQVRARLEHGEDFAAVAKQVTIDPMGKDNGGDLGAASRDEIRDKGFGDAAFAAPANSVFGPVQSSPEVWSVGQVLEVAPITPLSLDQVRDSVRAQLYALRKLQKFSAWQTEQMKDAHVRYADAYRPADPTTIPGPQLAPPGEQPK